MEMWRRRREAASAAALYSVYHGLYSEAVVSSVASAVALAEMGRFGETVQYVQKAAKALYEAAREAFEKVKVTVQHLVELFVEAVARVLAWIDAHKAYLFLMAAVAAGVVALSVALNLWGLVELEKLAYAASLTPFISAGVKEYSREETFNILKNDPNPYEKFKNIANDANDGKVKLAEPWESLRKLILPKKSEASRLMTGKLYFKYHKDENYKRALFYAVLALEETFDVYRSALRKLEEAFGVYRKDVEEREKVVQKVEVGEEPFKQDVYVADLEKIKQLIMEEEAAFEKALRTLRKGLNKYAVRYGLGGLLNVEESKARELAEAEYKEFSKFGGVNFGVKALAALIAYREHALGWRSAFGTVARYWLGVGGSAWLLYYAPRTAYKEAEKAGAERPITVEETVAETLRRLFLKPGSDHHRDFVELLGGSKLALILEDKTESSYVFRLFRLEEGGRLVDLGIKLRIEKVRESIIYVLMFDDVERWQKFFKQELEAAIKAAVEVGGRLPVEDRLPYMLSWIASDVAISGRGNRRVLEISTSHLWQLAETHALFDWSYVAVPGASLTLEGPKPQFYARTSLEKLDEAIRRSAEGGWLMMLGVRAESWDGLKRWVSDHWSEVIDAVKKRLEGVKVSPGFDLAGALVELEGLKSRLDDDDKIAREVIAPALLLMQAERLGVNETTLRYFGAVISGAIDGDGYVSAAMKRIQLISGKLEVALLWIAAFAAYGIKTKIGKGWGAYRVNAFGDDAVKLARLYFLFGPPLLEGDEKVKSHKLAEAVKLGAEGLNIRWEGLRRTRGGAAADLTISEGDTAVKYNVYLRKNAIVLEFSSADRSHVDLAARLLRLAGVSAEVKRKGDEDIWHVRAATDMLAAGRKELRDALAEFVKKAVENSLVKADKAERWLEKLESGRMWKEEWPNEVMLAGARWWSDIAPPTATA
jgi:hypothetical protein